MKKKISALLPFAYKYNEHKFLIEPTEACESEKNTKMFCCETIKRYFFITARKTQICHFLMDRGAYIRKILSFWSAFILIGFWKIISIKERDSMVGYLFVSMNNIFDKIKKKLSSSIANL